MMKSLKILSFFFALLLLGANISFAQSQETKLTEAIRSCSYAVKFAEGKNITTIEGLGTAEMLHPVQQAWMEEVVPQCGYCQPGFMMATAALLEKVPNPTDEDIDNNIVNVCRCATYYRMRKAIHRAAEINRSVNSITQ